MSSSVYDSDSFSQYSFEPCSPCSSGFTCVHDDGQIPPPAPSHCMTIFLPNLIDHISVTVAEVESFVSASLNQDAEITIAHLLIYLFSENSNLSSVTHINDIKLIHKGKPYSIQRACDLSDKLPKLKDVVNQFPTFQLITASTTSRNPLKMPVNTMLSKISLAAAKNETSTVTYAEAMIKLFKKPSRKSSIGSLDSSATTTRHVSHGSATDVEDNNVSVRPTNKKKFRSSLKRMFSKPPASSPQARMAETLLFSL